MCTHLTVEPSRPNSWALPVGFGRGLDKLRMVSRSLDASCRIKVSTLASLALHARIRMSFTSSSEANKRILGRPKVNQPFEMNYHEWINERKKILTCDL